MKRTFTLIALVSLLALVSVPASAATKSKSAVPPAIPAAELQAKYAAALTSGEKVRILIVPGHEPTLGGTEYEGFYEREMVLEIAEKLAGSLAANPHFEVMTTRTVLGWTPEFASYFKSGEKKTKKFVADQRKVFEKNVKKGDVEERTEEVPHATARNDIAIRLYGVNRWANENGIDLLVHLHINDTGGGEALRKSTSGYAIYVPDAQYGNGPASAPIANAIAARLSALSATSTLPIEDKGVVEDQSLIAIGSYGTLAAPSVLIEYGYITEPKFLHIETRRTVSTDLAYQTYRGIQDFFKDPSPVRYPSLVLPYAWMEGKHKDGANVHTYALQAALRSLGFYPGDGKTLTACPISGIWDECTTAAVKAFQASKNLTQTGEIGPATKAALIAAGV